MEIKDLNDFYVDLDGDIKANAPDHSSKFITDTDKPNSQYKLAESRDEIIEAIKQVNSNYVLELDVLKQYAIKTDKNGKIVAVKVWSDCDEAVDDANNLTMILLGIEIGEFDTGLETYFTCSKTTVDELIDLWKINYKVPEFDTHSPVLYSVKKDGDTVTNFKTYYVVNAKKDLFTDAMAKEIKAKLKFF